MDEADRDPFDVLREEYEAGNPQALLDALRFALSREPAAGWAREAVRDAMTRWNNGDTREFAEPWGLVRPKGWQQGAHQERAKPDARFGWLSRRGAILKRTLDLIYPSEGRGLPKSDATWELVAGEFAAYGVKAAEVKAAYYEWRKLCGGDGLGDSPTP